jgi:hypothetical protein
MAKGLIEDYLEDERRRLLAESGRMMQDRLDASIHSLMRTPAQNMLTATASSLGAQGAVPQSGMHKERGVVGDFRIEQVHGGFIVCIGREPYGPAERHIAITMEDVSRIVLSQLTSNMLEKT